LDRSPIFDGLLQGRSLPVVYSLNGREYTTPYYLADGIYPKWPTLIQSIPHPRSEKDRNFAKAQEACRKDVERAFGVLQARFAMIAQPARTWSLDRLSLIMKACIIMHNMAVGYNDEAGLVEPLEPSSEIEGLPVEQAPSFDDFVQNYQLLHSQVAHAQLKEDLVEHLWARKGNE
jgi:hypothetical protein